MKTTLSQARITSDGLIEKQYEHWLDPICEEYQATNKPIPNFGSALRYQRFEGKKWYGVDFSDNDLTGSEFVACDLRGSSFEHSLMDNVRLIECHLYGSDLPSNPSLILVNCCRDSISYDTQKFGVSGNAERLARKKSAIHPIIPK